MTTHPGYSLDALNWVLQEDNGLVRLEILDPVPADVVDALDGRPEVHRILDLESDTAYLVAEGGGMSTITSMTHGEMFTDAFPEWPSELVRWAVDQWATLAESFDDPELEVTR